MVTELERMPGDGALPGLWDDMAAATEGAEGRKPRAIVTVAGRLEDCQVEGEPVNSEYQSSP